ncbi:Hypothetical_protein [Hexamita inflata]|uniref:Hypothetical_protein n=1 Tax=Hexamita inflata TaxID=28002 RepID=A0AA86QU68_9EUKA|nr:Hypothetical protein HINF_LOCUS39404 [Hexamita inflata]CAI9959404.1 Hypothetical protein HINF_LOCUS47049 [Hexamita inflata]CAI9969512.1 Hypothetical protein HINF_LOCUS57157 [Hexamita inflata]
MPYFKIDDKILEMIEDQKMKEKRHNLRYQMGDSILLQSLTKPIQRNPNLYRIDFLNDIESKLQEKPMVNQVQLTISELATFKPDRDLVLSEKHLKPLEEMYKDKIIRDLTKTQKKLFADRYTRSQIFTEPKNIIQKQLVKPHQIQTEKYTLSKQAIDQLRAPRKLKINKIQTQPQPE